MSRIRRRSLEGGRVRESYISVKSGIRCRSRSNMSCALQPSAAQGSKRREGLRLPLDGTWTRAGWKTKSGDSCRLRGTQGLLLLLPLPFDQRGCSSFRASVDIPSGYLDCIGAPGASHHLIGWNRLLLICYQSELYPVHKNRALDFWKLPFTNSSDRCPQACARRRSTERPRLLSRRIL